MNTARVRTEAALLGLAAVALLLVLGPPGPARAAVSQPSPAASIAGVERAQDGSQTPPSPWTVASTATTQTVVPTGATSLEVPILMYHYITVKNPADRMGFALSVAPADFNAQMDWLDENGFHPITLNDLRAYFAGQRTLPGRPVVLTFDDGYRDFYTTALPILEAHHFTAVNYVVTGLLGGPNYMTREMVVDIDRRGIEVGSHTVSHVDMTKVTDDRLLREVVENRTVLEQMVGHPVLDFCYPSGRFNQHVIDFVKAAGYQSATTTAEGVTHALNDSRFTWPRTRVNGGATLEKFAEPLLRSHQDGMVVTTRTAITLAREYPLIWERPRLEPGPSRFGVTLSSRLRTARMS